MYRRERNFPLPCASASIVGSLTKVEAPHEGRQFQILFCKKVMGGVTRLCITLLHDNNGLCL